MINQSNELRNGDQCTVVSGTHKGKSGIVQDLNISKTGHITITVLQKNGVRFKTLGKNVVVQTDNNITTVMPFLTVNNGKKAVDFYVSALGAIEITRYDMSDEKLTSKISIEGAEFWVGDEEPQFGNLSPDLKSNSPVRIILKTKNADELFENALKFGATEICPMTTEDEWRIGKLKDPFGHIWEIGYTL